MKERFEINIKNRFEKLVEEVTASNFWEIVKEEATKLAGKTKKKSCVLSEIDQNTKQPICMGYIDYWKKHLTPQNMTQILKALRTTGTNEAYVTILEDVYTEATARVHMDNQVSEKRPTQRGARQGDPISLKLFITIQKVSKDAQLQENGKILMEKNCPT